MTSYKFALHHILFFCFLYWNVNGLHLYVKFNYLKFSQCGQKWWKCFDQEFPTFSLLRPPKSKILKTESPPNRKCVPSHKDLTLILANKYKYVLAKRQNLFICSAFLGLEHVWTLKLLNLIGFWAVSENQGLLCQPLTSPLTTPCVPQVGNPWFRRYVI